MEMGKQGQTPVDHRPGSRHHDGAATAGSHPVSLAAVVALQPHAFIFADVMAANWQNIVIDHVIIRAVKPGMPVFKTAEQPSPLGTVHSRNRIDAFWSAD